MELNEIQVSVTALFLLTAVAIVVLCDLLRRKRQAYCKATSQSGLEPEPPQFFAQSSDEEDRVSYAHEIAALTAAGMREENSAWTKIEPASNHCETYHRAPVNPTQARPEPIGAPSPAMNSTNSSKALQLPPATVDDALFELLLSGRTTPKLTSGIASEPAPAPLPSAAPQFVATPVAPAPNSPARPRGMIDALTLEGILKTNKPFTGVAVSISATGAEGRPLSEGQLEWVASYVESLLEENDYGCRISREEFVIACPGVQRAEAQQRINEISQRLWEFQLRGIGNRSVMFGWGGVEARNESLGDALASAVERMHLNQNGRNRIYVHALTAHNQVV